MEDKEKYVPTEAEKETLSDTTDEVANAAQEEVPIKE